MSAAPAPDDLVAEWVGLHYFLNFDAMNAIGKAEWRARYAEAHSGVES